MNPAAFHLVHLIAALKRQADELPPFSVRRAAILNDLDVLRDMLRRATT